MSFCGCVGLVLGFVLPNTSFPLIATLFASTLLGSLYSIPPIRLKRYPLLASFCILVVRGVLVNIGFSQHARIVAGYGATLSASCLFYSVFFALFGIAIALMKDIPDVKVNWKQNVNERILIMIFCREIDCFNYDPFP